MLPTGQAADAAVGTLINPESNAVAFSPNRALGVGGLELTMAAENLTLTANKENRAIGSPASSFIELDYTDYYVNLGIAGSLAEAIGGGAGDFYGICQVVPPQLQCGVKSYEKMDSLAARSR
jgi:hypothetical protein